MLLYGLRKHLAHVRATDPGIGEGAPGDDPAITGIDKEGGADDILISAGELQPIAAPPKIQAHHHLAVMGAFGSLEAGALQKRAVVFS